MKIFIEKSNSDMPEACTRKGILGEQALRLRVARVILLARLDDYPIGTSLEAAHICRLCSLCT